MTVLETIFNYISRYIIPITLIPLAGSVIFGYAGIQMNGLNTLHNKEVVERIDKQHNSRITVNQVSIDRLHGKITTVEILLPQILSGISDIKGDMKLVKKEMGKLGTTVAVLKDRTEREYRVNPDEK